MRYFFPLIILILLVSCSSEEGYNDSQATDETDPGDVHENVESDPFAYDSVYAESIGADEYGMKPYVMAFLKTGPNQSLDSASSAEIQIAHMDNINRLAEEGKLVLAGPFYNQGESDLRGIYLFDVATIEEAEELTKSDPAVQEGVFVMELIPWYGSAALMDINNLHKKAAKIEI